MKNQNCGSLRQRRNHLLLRKFQPRFPCRSIYANEFESDQFGTLDKDANEGYDLCRSDWSGRSVWWLSGSVVLTEQGTSLQSLTQAVEADRNSAGWRKLGPWPRDLCQQTAPRLQCGIQAQLITEGQSILINPFSGFTMTHKQIHSYII